MGIRSSVVDALGGPLAALLDAAVRELVDDVLASRALVTHREVESVMDRVERLRRELAERRSEVEAIRQAIDATLAVFDDDLGADTTALADDLVNAEGRRARLTKDLERTDRAVQTLAAQLTEVSGGVAAARARAEQAHQIATTARSTAEAAVECLSELESRNP